MTRTSIAACLVLGLLALGGPTQAQQPADGDTHRQRAEQILDQPRFGETRPTLWDRLTGWLDDRFSSNAEPTTNPSDGDAVGGTGNESDPNGGQTSPNGDTSGTEANENGEPIPEASPNGTDGALAGPATPQGMMAAALQLVLGAGIVVAVALGARWLIRRRSAAAPRDKPVPVEALPPVSPEELVDQAERASRAGDYATAIRLRFKAGIVRLGRRGVVVGGEHTTNPGISQQLDLEEFDRLASAFERVVYGGHEADAAVDSDSRDTWPTVIKKAKT